MYRYVAKAVSVLHIGTGMLRVSGVIIYFLIIKDTINTERNLCNLNRGFAFDTVTSTVADTGFLQA